MSCILTLLSVFRSVHHPVLHHADRGGDASAAAGAGPWPEAQGGRRRGLEKGEMNKVNSNRVNYISNVDVVT